MNPNFEKLFKLLNVPIIGDRFINQTGLIKVKETCLSPEANKLFSEMNITSETSFEQSGEFNAKLTYMMFGSSSKNGSQLNKEMVEQHQHLSVYGDWSVTFLVVGITDEVLKELIAHREGHISRLTSSKTKAQTNTYYRIWGTPEQQQVQMEFINEFLIMKKNWQNHENYSLLGLELSNSLNLPCKVAVAEITMTLKDYHKLFIGRCGPNGNEYLIQELAGQMADNLHESYPLLIKTKEEYIAMNNGEKLKI